MSTAITRGARDILTSEATVCDGNALTIAGQLPAAQYAEIKRVLEAAGGKWDKRAQATLFPGDAAAALAALLAGDRVVSAAEADQWYPTPAEIAGELAELALFEPGMEVLEPSAGLGALAREAIAAGCTVDCVELVMKRAGTLKDAGARNVWIADFLDVPPRAEYDRVIMNPPFTGRADTKHVLHALQFVKPGGLLAAVMGSGVTFRTDRDAVKVREMAASITPLPGGAFSESGAEIATALVVIPVPGADGLAPVRGGRTVAPFTVRVNGNRLFRITPVETFWCGDLQYVPVDCRDIRTGMESQSIVELGQAVTRAGLIADEQTRDAIRSAYANATRSPGDLSGAWLPDDYTITDPAGGAITEPAAPEPEPEPEPVPELAGTLF